MKSALLALMVAIAACGGASERPAQTAQTGHDDIARIHKARCGSCHMRVEPGERTRAELETALARHRKRVRLSEEQWGELVGYLAAPEPAATAK